MLVSVEGKILSEVAKELSSIVLSFSQSCLYPSGAKRQVLHV